MSAFDDDIEDAVSDFCDGCGELLIECTCEDKDDIAKEEI